MPTGACGPVSRVPREAAEEEDFRFWYEGLTPAERVLAVYEYLRSSLQARGIDEVPRLRRVHRRIQRKRRPVMTARSGDDVRVWALGVEAGGGGGNYARRVRASRRRMAAAARLASVMLRWIASRAALSASFWASA